MPKSCLLNLGISVCNKESQKLAEYFCSEHALMAAISFLSAVLSQPEKL